MDELRALLDEIAGMVAHRERRTVDLLVAGCGLTDPSRQETVQAHVEQRRRHHVAHGVPAVAASTTVHPDPASHGWARIATATTVGSCLEAVLLTEVIRRLGEAVDELSVDMAHLERVLLEEPKLPDFVWQDGSRDDSATALHDALRWVQEQLLQRRGMVAVLGREGTLSAFAAMLEAYPSLNARLGTTQQHEQP